MPDRPASREELLQHLEKISGRSIRTRADLEAYVNEVKAQVARPSPAARRWAIVKHATLGVGLLIAVLQYYLIDIYVQVASLQGMQFFTPVAAPVRKSALELLRLLC